MAAHLNRVQLIGNLGADPEGRFTGSGDPVANFRLATTKTVGKGDEATDYTEWHRIVAFNGLADIATKYLRKGSQVYVEGELRTRKWEKDGEDQYTTEIVALDIQMLGKKPAADQ